MEELNKDLLGNVVQLNELLLNVLPQNKNPLKDITLMPVEHIVAIREAIALVSKRTRLLYASKDIDKEQMLLVVSTTDTIVEILDIIMGVPSFEDGKIGTLQGCINASLNAYIEEVNKMLKNVITKKIEKIDDVEKKFYGRKKNACKF